MIGNMKTFRNILATGRAIQSLKCNTQVINRKSHVVSYRSAPPPHSKATKIGAVVVGGTMWWWVIWHLWHEPDHITGEFDYPDAAKWTNIQLGIPRDV
ncbi:NADH dehydrogenase [ubiquinone] 1 beta subcomplex subunit 2, mitochondrial-like [Drosophila albomicans]|uniref:NADH dehydrogenase [ubiquinone] 1 beta subcomplex subunit 2, mitochondrial-like n=1 Tax=Drosophila albomicans TaxID=7291 RepID=A0A6P8XKP2_DROAB|nr:NADH dehydrogenase [ubiquinone] 1 beta subcomplex subunit 2, mitochondrial-like [Drosophila albomicans]